jgi:hypothetical protein
MAKSYINKTKGDLAAGEVVFQPGVVTPVSQGFADRVKGDVVFKAWISEGRLVDANKVDDEQPASESTGASATETGDKTDAAEKKAASTPTTKKTEE